MKTLIRYGEIHLKSEPVKKEMLKILKNNIKNATNENVKIISGRLKLNKDNNKIKDKLKRTFGVVSFSPCVGTEKNVDNIKNEAKKFFQNFNGTFAIRATRADKQFKYTSKDLENIVGETIVNLGNKVNLDNPEKTLFIEIRDKAYLYENIINGPGGMPLGTAGCVNTKLNNRKDLLASWYIMKRGVEINVKGKQNLIKILKKWSVGRKLLKSCSNNIFVSSETNIENIQKLQEDNKNVLFPLVGLTKKEIKNKISFVESEYMLVSGRRNIQLFHY